MTPNIQSLGHRRFGADWVGLDRPRHLNVFSVDTLGEVARRAGLENVRISTTAVNAKGIAQLSVTAARKRGFREFFNQGFWTTLGLVAFQYEAIARRWVSPRSGEELFFEAWV